MAKGLETHQLSAVIGSCIMMMTNCKMLNDLNRGKALTSAFDEHSQWLQSKIKEGGTRPDKGMVWVVGEVLNKCAVILGGGDGGKFAEDISIAGS